jgi:hypothetical protein
MSAKVSTAPAGVGNLANVDIISAQIVADAEKIVDNILLGDCPIELDKVFVFFQNTVDIQAKNAVKILVNYVNPVVETADALLLERLCTRNGSLNLSMGDDLKEIRDSGQYQSLEAAVPALVDLALKVQWATANDVERLRAKFKVWLKGCRWTDCEDEVLARGLQLPWDYHGYMYTKSLYDGVLGNNMVVVFENEHPVDIVGPDHINLFQELWSVDNGACHNVEHAVITAMALAFEFNNHVQSRVARSERSISRRSGKGKPKSGGCCTS